MNKLVACALLGFGLTQVLVGCSDDDDAPPDGGSGTAGTSNGGSSTAGKSSGGSSSAGKGGSATAGSATAGSATGGNATAGSAGKGGSATAGTSAGGEGGVPGGAGEAGMAGMAGMAGETGDGGMAGAGGAPTVEPPKPATPLWLSDFCEAKSLEVLGCEDSKEWYQCFSPLRPFMYSVGEGICPGEEELETPVKTLALYDAMDALAAACPDPDVEQWQCTLGAPRAKDQACQDADDAVLVAFANCNP
jgi:hypothetical protein